MTTETCDASRGGRTPRRFCPFCGHPLHDRFWEGAVRRFCRRCRRPIYENPVPAACVVVPDGAGRILLVRRGVAPKKGFWCLPGGFMELGEAPEAAALRELKEEAGLEGRIECLLGLRSTPSRLYHTILLAAYLVRTEGQTPVAGDDATAARWFDPADLPPVAFDSHRKFIRRFVDLNQEHTGQKTGHARITERKHACSFPATRFTTS